MKKTLVTIGLPVLNGEKFIKKRLEGIENQTFQDFELLIYDNSIDLTPQICKKFVSKENRIRYFYEKDSKGIEYAYKFLLKKAKSKYFVWAAVDDVWKHDFLEKNICVLENNPDVVGSIGKVKKYGPLIEEFQSNSNDLLFVRWYKRIRRSFRHFGPIPIFFNSYEDRASKFLRTKEELSTYAVFRTEALQDSFVDGPSTWKKTMIKVLKYGNLNVVNEVLWFWWTGSSGISNLYEQYKKKSVTWKGVVLSWHEYTVWCIRNIGIKFFIKNIDFFILSNLFHSFILFKTSIQILKMKLK